MSEIPVSQPPAGVVFDLDGTLLDTERMYWKSFEAAALAADLDFPKAFYVAMVGGPEARTHALLKERFGEEFSIEGFERAWRSEFQKIVAAGQITAKTCAIDMLNMLTKHEVPIAVATSSHRELVEQTMTSASIRKFFEHIVCGDEVVRGKPEPEIYLTACERIQRSPQDCIAFEDTEIGMSAATAAGLRCVLVPDMKQPSEMGSKKAFRNFQSLCDALPWLQTALTDR